MARAQASNSEGTAATYPAALSGPSATTGAPWPKKGGPAPPQPRKRARAGGHQVGGQARGTPLWDPYRPGGLARIGELPPGRGGAGWFRGYPSPLRAYGFWVLLGQKSIGTCLGGVSNGGCAFTCWCPRFFGVGLLCSMRNTITGQRIERDRSAVRRTDTSSSCPSRSSCCPQSTSPFLHSRSFEAV